MLEKYSNTTDVGSDDSARQTRKLAQTLRNRKGRFALVFAVCNNVPLRRRITSELANSLPDQHLVELQLSGNETSLLDTLLGTPGSPEPLIVHGVELLLPSETEFYARREQTLQELQLRREQFRNLARPLVFWMPEYVYTMIGQQAVDFWSWQSGGFFFADQPLEKTVELVEDSSLSPQLEIPTVLRASIPYFVGREKEVVRAINSLREGRNVVIHGAQGMGGIGKTSLALFVADKLRKDYPDAQLFVPLHDIKSDSRSSAAKLRDVILSFRPDEKLPDDISVLTALYRSLLRGKRALIVLDDAPHTAAIRPFLPPKGSALLVTSRSEIRLSDATYIELNHLSRVEALELLLRVAPQVPEEVAEEICYLCGYLPLPIQIVGGLLSSVRSIDPKELVTQLQQQARTYKSNGDGVESSLEASLQLSYKRLERKTARVFRQLAVFPLSFDTAAESVICRDRDGSCLRELINHHLVMMESSNRYRMHNAVREFAKIQLTSKERTTVARRHANYYLTILSKASGLYSKRGEFFEQGLTLFDNEWENISAGQVWSATHLEKDVKIAEMCAKYADAGVDLLRLRMHPNLRVQWLESAILATRHLSKPLAEARHLNELGRAYTDLGEPYSAIEAYERGLSITYEQNNMELEIDILTNLGEVYENIGKYDRLLALYEQILNITHTTQNKSNEGQILNRLGLVYSKLGQSNHAIEVYEQALTIARQIGSSTNEMVTLNNLGRVYVDLGEPRRAIEMYHQALDIARQIGDRSYEGRTLNRLGIAYSSLGELRRAVDVYEQALSIARQIGDRRTEGNVLMAMSRAFEELSDRTNAIFLMEAAVNIFEQIESPNLERARRHLNRWRDYQKQESLRKNKA